MRYLLLFLILSCAEPPEVEEEIRERVLVAYVCYNPSSIWHLSECNDECEKRNYSGEAYCLSLFDVMCEQPNRRLFIIQACGLYYN